ncbi:MAG: hypothetical protein GSR72_08180 [Desulfurococcales archaeon]|nr:hypothetical protein [Desulfurococcales archaeon]MEB3789849.1 hypothetical protein [Desulfurococcales archaeon]
MLWNSLIQKRLKISLSRDTARLVDYYIKHTGKGTNNAIETLIGLGFEYWTANLKTSPLASELIEDNLRYRTLLLETSEKIRTLTVIISSLLSDLKGNCETCYTKKHKRIESYIEKLYEYSSMLVIEATTKK